MTTPRITDYARAGFPAIWLSTHEPHRAVAELGAALRADGVRTFSWDVLSGVREHNGGVTPVAPNCQDPVTLCAWACTQAPAPSAIFATFLHRFTGAIDAVQSIVNAAPALKARQVMLVALVPPGSQLPVELDRLFAVYDHELPADAALDQILCGLEHADDPLTVPDRPATIAAMRGLTAMEAESAVALSGVLGDFCADPAIVQREKAALIKKSACLELSASPLRFGDLGGLDNLKDFLRRMAPDARARGVILLGVPGCGKSAIAYALGNELHRPTITMDVGRMMGSLVGASEANMRGSLGVIDAFGESVVVMDEIEKGFSGMGSSGQTDGGTTARVGATFLTWQQDRTCPAFVVGTCNDVTRLPPELLRAERWDAIFFVDLPTAAERAAIFAIHASAYGITPETHGETPDLTDWTGAEIKSLCRIASMMRAPLCDARKYVTNIARSRAEDIAQLRSWARERTVPASTPEAAPDGRKIRR